MKNTDAIVWKDGTITYKDELGNIRTSQIDDVKIEVSNIINEKNKLIKKK